MMTEMRLFGVRMALNAPSGQSLKWILYCDHELHYVLDDQRPSTEGFWQSFSVWSFEEKTFVKQSMISEWEKVAQKVCFTHYTMLLGGGGGSIAY